MTPNPMTPPMPEPETPNLDRALAFYDGTTTERDGETYHAARSELTRLRKSEATLSAIRVGPLDPFNAPASRIHRALSFAREHGYHETDEAFSELHGLRAELTRLRSAAAPGGDALTVEECERLMDEAWKEAGEEPGDLSSRHWEAIYKGVEKIRSLRSARPLPASLEECVEVFSAARAAALESIPWERKVDPREDADVEDEADRAAVAAVRSLLLGERRPATNTPRVNDTERDADV
jgi:hypothetical protein